MTGEARKPDRASGPLAGPVRRPAKRYGREDITLDSLPMFASDHDLALAIVGPKAAKDWLERLPVLEGQGFPKVDDFHGGRPVPLVRLFYATYLGVPKSGDGKPDGEEDPAAWKKSA